MREREQYRIALDAADTYRAAAREEVRRRVAPTGAIEPARLDEAQFAAHGLAWIATYVEALRQLLGWAERIASGNRLGRGEQLILTIGFGEYLAQLTGGIAMSQSEMVRPRDLGLTAEAASLAAAPAVQALVGDGASSAARSRLTDHLVNAPAEPLGDTGLDETLALVRDQFRRFVADAVAPHAGAWHDADQLIPQQTIDAMAALGVFGMTIAEDAGGLGMDRTAMCVVTEELSRGYLGVGSLGTRSEIAAEMIAQSGTPQQQERYLRGIADGTILPTAVFTEPEAGSDLAHLRTRAVRDGDVYRVSGNKTWATHAARADLMLILVRTDPAEPGHRGISMLLAEKPRGTTDDSFPVDGMSGGEIAVLGYRGMKEYEIAFDDFIVPAEGLLGGIEGQGFRQLMRSFETARIQTAARAVGVAQNALDLGLAYARERVQFDRPIVAFPRVGGKLAWMAVETMIARQLTHFAARQKDSGKRCDIEAGMAKLLAARVAWANADSALQIHGGNGYACEYAISRVLCDARILNIFEGAAEIQAHIIARGLLAAAN